MKYGFLPLSFCVAASLLPLSTAPALAEEPAPLAPQASQAAPASPHFAVENLNAAADFDPMMGWSEPPGTGTRIPKLMPVPSGRYAMGNAAWPNRASIGKFPGVADFVSDDNVSATIRNVALEAGELTNEGLKLAGKGAVFSARAKFVAALELIADARDAKHETQFHSRADRRFNRPSRGRRFQPSERRRGGRQRPRRSGGRPLDPPDQKRQAEHRHAACRCFSCIIRTPRRSCRPRPETSPRRRWPFIISAGFSHSWATASIGRPFWRSPRRWPLNRPPSWSTRRTIGRPTSWASCSFAAASWQARKALAYSASICHRAEVLDNLAAVYRRLGDAPGAASIAALAKDAQRPALRRRWTTASDH